MARFEHDCDNCQYLGEWQEFDLYYCDPKREYMDTVIARWGDDGPDYVSGMGINHPALLEAVRLANAGGFISEDQRAYRASLYDDKKDNSFFMDKVVEMLRKNEDSNDG